MRQQGLGQVVLFVPGQRHIITYCTAGGHLLVSFTVPWQLRKGKQYQTTWSNGVQKAPASSVGYRHFCTPKSRNNVQDPACQRTVEDSAEALSRYLGTGASSGSPRDLPATPKANSIIGYDAPNPSRYTNFNTLPRTQISMGRGIIPTNGNALQPQNGRKGLLTVLGQSSNRWQRESSKSKSKLGFDALLAFDVAPCFKVFYLCLSKISSSFLLFAVPGCAEIEGG
ncbi:hypothetical protein BKA61DRAFT_698564 [Leptodontidium sp. MPI-SDFR-AT-0119]|nr:hypothetical protein BKA61DRAFT_698564 [Leptodontidium sp. MPI-SDFR-AT-0119]